MKTFNLVFKWGTSRGRETYGYTTCTLRVDGRKVASCNGGGYDMAGTAFGDWIANAFPDRLLRLKKEFYGLSYHDPDYDPGKAKIDGETVESREERGESLGLERYQQFYSASSKTPTKRHKAPLIDGACGFSSVQRILEAIGGTVQKIHGTSKEDVFTVTMTARMPR